MCITHKIFNIIEDISKVKCTLFEETMKMKVTIDHPDS